MSDVVDSGINDVRWQVAVGKLKLGVSIEQAQAAMNVTQRHLSQVFPETYKNVGVRVDPLQKRLFGHWAGAYYTVFGVAGLVLLIACVNVANLIWRGDGRRRDGCARGDGRKQRALIRQEVSPERFAFADRGTGGSAAFFSQRQNLQHHGLHSGFRAKLASGGWQGSAVHIRHLCSDRDRLWSDPAYRAVRTNLNECLQEGARSTATFRAIARNALVVTEIAVAGVADAAGLMINTLTAYCGLPQASLPSIC